jgi:hypothetical protein
MSGSDSNVSCSTANTPTADVAAGRFVFQRGFRGASLALPFPPSVNRIPRPAHFGIDVASSPIVVLITPLTSIALDVALAGMSGDVLG